MNPSGTHSNRSTGSRSLSERAAPAACEYQRPFETAAPMALIPLPAGAVEPQGWLRDRCLAARDGYTGHMDDVHEDFRHAWAADYTMKGERLSYWSLGAWPYEGGGYWFDGLVRLAFALNDDDLKRQALARLGVVAERMNDKGLSFIWWLDRNCPEDVAAATVADGWPIWANGLFGRALAAGVAVTNDLHIMRALEAGYAGDSIWRRQFSNVWPAMEAWSWSGNETIQAALTEIFTRQDDNRYRRMPDLTPGVEHDEHGMFFNECALFGALGFLWTGDRSMYDIAASWYAFVAREAMQPHGVIVADEHYGPSGAFRGTETCAVAAHLWSRLVLLMAGGDGVMADQNERAFFNAGATAVAPDYRSHVYHQTPNRVADRGGQYSYAASHSPLCCTAALNRILPYYVTHLWMATPDNGLAAVHYGPCRLTALAGDGVRVQIACQTDYPFNEMIVMAFEPERPVAFPLSLRIPGWCTSHNLVVNGEAVAATPDAKGFVRLERTWRSGDTIALQLPMVPRVETGVDVNVVTKLPYLPDQAALHRAGGVQQAAPFATVSYGPLLFALGIPEAPAATDGNTPAATARWAYALDDLTGENIVVERDAMPARWDWPLASPLRLRVPGVRCEWRPGDNEPLPLDPVSDGPRETLMLVPYGCTRFRISMFPVTERAWRPRHRAWAELTPFVKALRVSRPVSVPDGEGRLVFPEGDAAPGLEWQTFDDAHCRLTRMQSPLESEWMVYGPIPANTGEAYPPRPDLETAPESWRVAPASIVANGVQFPGRRLRSDGGVLYVPDHNCPTLLAATEWESEEDGLLQLAFSADWCVRWWVNGQPVYSTYDQGNGFHPETPPAFAHMFQATVRQGRNLIVLQLAGGQAMGCRAAMEAVRVPAGQPAAEGGAQRAIYAAHFTCAEPMRLEACLGYDGPTQVWLDRRLIYDDPDGSKIAMLPAEVRAHYPVTRLVPDAVRLGFETGAGPHELHIARGLLKDRDTGILLRFRRVDMPAFDPAVRPVLPEIER